MKEIGVTVTCECGETLAFLSEREGFYRLRHGDRFEAISPEFDSAKGERSFAWRRQVHEYLGRGDKA